MGSNPTCLFRTVPGTRPVEVRLRAVSLKLLSHIVSMRFRGDRLTSFAIPIGDVSRSESLNGSHRKGEPARSLSGLRSLYHGAEVREGPCTHVAG